jgi:hypothetical protein
MAKEREEERIWKEERWVVPARDQMCRSSIVPPYSPLFKEWVTAYKLYEQCSLMSNELLGEENKQEACRLYDAKCSQWDTAGESYLEAFQSIDNYPGLISQGLCGVEQVLREAKNFYFLIHDTGPMGAKLDNEETNFHRGILVGEQRDTTIRRCEGYGSRTEYHGWKSGNWNHKSGHGRCELEEYPGSQKYTHVSGTIRSWDFSWKNWGCCYRAQTIYDEYSYISDRQGHNCPYGAG